MTPPVRQQLVETHDPLREAKRAFCRLLFREDRPSRAKIDLGREVLKSSKLMRNLRRLRRTGSERKRAAFVTPISTFRDHSGRIQAHRTRKSLTVSGAEM